MKTIEALRKLAKKVCSTATDTDLNKFNTIDEVINYIAEKFDGGTPAVISTSNISGDNQSI